MQSESVVQAVYVQQQDWTSLPHAHTHTAVCWWRESPERTDTTTVMSKHTIQVVNILSLFNVPPQ